MKNLNYRTIYKIIFGLYMLGTVLQNCMLTSKLSYLWASIKFISLIIGIGYIVIRLCCGVYKNSLIKSIFVVILLAYTSFRTKSYVYLSLALLIICSDKITDSEFLNLFFKWQLFDILFCIFSWPIGIVFKLESLFYNPYNNEHRISLGFIHPNIAAINILWTLIAYIIINYKTSNFNYKAFNSLIIAIMAHIITQSAIFYYYYIFMAIIFLLKLNFMDDFIVFLGKNIFWILGILILIVIKAYGGWGPTVLQQISQILNKLSTERISMSSLALITNGLTFWGQTVLYNNPQFYWTAKYNYQNYTIDMFYTYLAINIGMIYFLLLSIAFFKLCKTKGSLFSSCVIVFSLVSLANNNLLFITTTFVTFYIRDFIFDKKETVYLHDLW